MLSSESNQEEGDMSSSEQTSPLGLTLRKTPSFLSWVEMKLSQSRTKNPSTEKHSLSARDTSRSKAEDPEKLKATNLPALLLKIGSWERFSRHEGDLVAKCYYAKKKIVWEVLEGALKSKIEIQWSDIVAIRAIIRDDEPGILEIELNQQPMFFRETNPQPRKHTLWQAATDFTGGQAPICRRHYVKFPPGTLDRHYEKLLQCDIRLFELSKRPFPNLESPYFYSSMYSYGDANLSFDFRSCPPLVPRGLQRSFSAIPSSSLLPPHAVHNLRLPTRQHIGFVDSDSPMSAHWGQGGNNVENIYARGDQIQGLQSSQTVGTQAGASFSCHNYQIPAYGGEAGRPYPNTIILSNIENHLLGDSSGPYSDETRLLEEKNFSHNIGTNQFGYDQERFSDGNAILDTSENFEVDSGLLYPQPINSFPPQVSNENLMMPNFPGQNYRYGSQLPNYEDVDAGRDEQQWP